MSTPPTVPQGLKRQPIPFGKYLLLDRVNVGGMAEVWRGKTFGADGTDRIVAIKRILPNIAEDEEFITMFIDEAKISVQLTHDNICQLHDLGNIGGSFFIAMEYIPGKDLRAIFDKCKKSNELPPVPLVCHAVARMSAGLDHAHRKKDLNGNDLNIVHRDISPQNCLVSYDGFVKVIDFGIAKAANKASRTQAGILKGKFGYMAPEQILGGDIDRRADVFAIGVVLWEMLTTQRLFVGDSDFAVLEKVRKADVPAPSKHNPRVPPELDRITLKALARDINTRYQYADELERDLDAFLAGTGSVFGTKEMAAFMKATFAEEVERERVRTVEYAAIKAPDPAAGRTPAGRAPTGSMPAVRPGRPSNPAPPARPGQPSTAGGVPAPRQPIGAKTTQPGAVVTKPGASPAAGSGPKRAPAPPPVPEPAAPSGPALTDMDDDELPGLDDLLASPPTAPVPQPAPAKVRAPLPAAVPTTQLPPERAAAAPPLPPPVPVVDLEELPPMEELPFLNDLAPADIPSQPLPDLPPMADLPGVEEVKTGEINLPNVPLAAVESTAIRPTPAAAPPAAPWPQDEEPETTLPSEPVPRGEGRPQSAAAPAQGGGKAGWIVAAAAVLLLLGGAAALWQLGLVEQLTSGELLLQADGALPPGAQVSVDGQARDWPSFKSGKPRPFYEVRVPGGRHVVEITAPGYAPWSAEMDVPARGKSTEEVSLERLAVKVKVTLSPEGALVKREGKVVREAGGEGPLELELTAEAELEVSAPGHVQAKVRVSPADAEKGLPVELKAARHAYALSSEPPGAAVFVDGKDLGKVTPAVVKLTVDQQVELRAPCHDPAPLALRAPKDGEDFVELSGTLVRQPNCTK